MSATGTFARGAVLDGRFRIIRLLGSGGMGDVYAAEQLSLARTVALKVLREEARLTPGMAERFRQEAQILSTVDHPGVVRVIDFGHVGGASFLVMDLVDGESLEQRLEGSGPMAASVAVALLRQIAEGLAAIHQRGIIHRDLKPSNVVLTPTLNGGRARLLDFGIAQLMDPSKSAAGNQPDPVLGTPEYISPEQAMGRIPDTRSDVYAFGVLAYQTLSGRLPHPGPSAREFLSQHVAREPTPLLEVTPSVPSDLAGLVMRCLSRDPGQRPIDGEGLSHALSSLVPQSDGEAATPLRRPTLRFGVPVEPPRQQNVALLLAACISPADPGRAADEVDRLLRPLLQDFRGEVAERRDASVIAAFRSPTDAARCGMALQDSFRGLSLPRAGPEFQVGVAIHVGEAMLGPETLSGDPVTLVSAMAPLVHAGEVFITETVRLSMNRVGVALEPQGWLPLTGGRALALYRCALQPHDEFGPQPPIKRLRAMAITDGDLWQRARTRLRQWKGKPG